MSIQIQKDVLLLLNWYVILFSQEIEDLDYVYVYRFVKNVCTTHHTMVVFMVSDIVSFNDVFSIYLPSKLTKLTVHLKVCH